MGGSDALMIVTSGRHFYAMECVCLCVGVPKKRDEKIFRCQEARCKVECNLFPSIFIN